VGDPKFSRAKYERPSHPWEGERIKAENDLLKKYGLKNKKELWRSQFVLRRFRQRARELQARVRTGDTQAEKEREQLLRRLGRLGLLPLEGTTLDDVLALDVEAVLSRRLQTLTFLKGLAFTPRQARQFIVHGHVSITGRRVTIPGYIVTRTEENGIAYDERSAISSDLHPARPGSQLPERPPAPAADEGEGPEDAEGPVPDVPTGPAGDGPGGA
jgi:small subunit ribosomal protein S4